MCIKLVTWNKSILWCTVRKTSVYSKQVQDDCWNRLRKKLHHIGLYHARKSESVSREQYWIIKRLNTSVLTVVLVGKPEGKRPLGRPRRRWEDNIKMDLQEVVGVVGTGWSWLRIGTGGGHLWVRWWTFGFQKMRGISWLAAEPVSFSRTLRYGVSK